MLTRYDAVAVLCGGLRCDGGSYHPATFTDSDEHGMLGSHLRVLAAAELYRAGCARVFLFSTGVSQKSRARFGPAVPAEAAVYAAHFRAETGAGPEVHLETGSVNTAGNCAAIAAAASRHGWARLAVLTSEYHLARVHELLRRPGGGEPAAILSAEAIVMAARPGAHDEQIAAAYASPAGLLRTTRERQGLADLYAGRYDPQEQVTAGRPVPAPGRSG
jgi:uncharacterized SAM-binding protein YcdF (DUF218 family)